jgi:site-specific recombinase XerD
MCVVSSPGIPAAQHTTTSHRKDDHRQRPRPHLTSKSRYASRNAAFTDLLIRAGLRISEQVALSLFELPKPAHGMVNARTWLPNAVAKNGSGRAIYIPGSVLKDLWDYIEMERADAVAPARTAGLYDRIHDPLIVEDPQVDRVRVGRQWIRVAQLDPNERRRLLVRTDEGLEPAALWLTGRGTPATVSAWQQVFKDANTRCARHGMAVRCHPHALRHSFAVITLEQLWRGHLAALGEMNLDQRETYQMVFGDPLNWVRMRLGHRSVQTTQLYLHTLQELEMQTRMALVPDSWEPVAVGAGDTVGQAA